MSKGKSIPEQVLGLGRKWRRQGGLKSGKARVKKIPPEKRPELARHAALARWGRKRKTKKIIYRKI